MPRVVLTLSCPDAPGIVADVAAWVSTVGGNIVEAAQHADLFHQLFLQRVEFDVEAGLDDLSAAFAEVGDRWAMTWQLRPTAGPARLAVLVTTEAHCLYDLLGRCATGDLDATVAIVASNRDTLREATGRFGVPFHHVPVVDDDRAAQEDAVLRLVLDAEVDLVVLARYMRILSPALCERIGATTINIHHSFLPAFVGAHAYRQAWERGVKLIGATAHYVTTDLDEGPIIAQGVTPVSHADTPTSMARRGRDLEAVVLARAVRAHLEHRVLTYANRTVVFE